MTSQPSDPLSPIPPLATLLSSTSDFLSLATPHPHPFFYALGSHLSRCTTPSPSLSLPSSFSLLHAPLPPNKLTFSVLRYSVRERIFIFISEMKEPTALLPFRFFLFLPLFLFLDLFLFFFPSNRPDPEDSVPVAGCHGYSCT